MTSDMTSNMAAETGETAQAVADISVNSMTVNKGLLMSAVVVIGIFYNLQKDPDALARAFSPGGLPIEVGYFCVFAGLFLVAWVGVRLFGLVRRPLIARAQPEGLYLKGMGVVPWSKITRLWFGAPFGDKPQRFGNCLFVDIDDAALNPMTVRLPGIGFLSDTAKPAGESLRLRYWVPFVFFPQKDAFRATVTLYRPQAIEAVKDGLPA